MTNSSTTPEQGPAEPFAPLLRTQRDVEEAWRTLIQPLHRKDRSMWFMVVASDDRPLPVLNEVTGLDDEIAPEDATAAARLWRRVLDAIEPGGRMAVLLCRSGAGGPTPLDRASAAALYEAGRADGVPMEVVHLATDGADGGDFWPIPADAV